MLPNFGELACEKSPTMVFPFVFSLRFPYFRGVGEGGSSKARETWYLKRFSGMLFVVLISMYSEILPESGLVFK